MSKKNFENQPVTETPVNPEVVVTDTIAEPAPNFMEAPKTPESTPAPIPEVKPVVKEEPKVHKRTVTL